MSRSEAGRKLSTTPLSWVLFVWAAALAALFSVAARANTSIKTITPRVLKVCLYPGFKPFMWKDGDTWKGWDVDFLQDFAQRNGLTFQGVEETDFNDIWLRPGRGECDIAATGISYTNARRKATGNTGEWSATYYTVVRAYLVRTEDQGKLTGISDMRDKTVVVTEGSTADSDLRNRLQQASIDNVVILDTNNEEAAARLVKNGCVFAYGGGYGSVEELTKLGGLTVVWPHCNMTKVGTNEFKPYAEPFSFVVRAASTGLLKALNSYIQHPVHPYEGTPNPADVKCQPPPRTQ